MAEIAIDPEARQAAKEASDTAHAANTLALVASTKIADHETHCADRWDENRKQLAALFRGQKWFAALIIAMQGAVIGFLATIAFGK